MEVLHFFIFLSIGIILGILYDIFKIFRILCRDDLFVFVIDILYFIIYFIIMFKTSIILNFEKIRYYMVFECCLGFIIYRISIRKFIFFISKNIVKFAKKRLPKIKLFIFHKKTNRNNK